MGQHVVSEPFRLFENREGVCVKEQKELPIQENSMAALCWMRR